MAVVTYETSQLSVDAEFADGDTRIITLENPKANITTAMITDYEQYILSNQILVGDKAGAAFSRIKEVKKIKNKKKVYTFS